MSIIDLSKPIGPQLREILDLRKAGVVNTDGHAWVMSAATRRAMYPGPASKYSILLGHPIEIDEDIENGRVYFVVPFWAAR